MIFPEFEEFNLDFDKLDEMKQSENVPSKPVKMPSGGLSGLRARMNSYDDKIKILLTLRLQIQTTVHRSGFLKKHLYSDMKKKKSMLKKMIWN